MYHAHPTPHVAAPIRTAALYRQPRRSDGAREFAIAVTALCLLLAASLAFVRGAPPKPAAPVASAPAPAAAAATPVVASQTS